MIIDALYGFILALPNALINSMSSVEQLVIPTGAYEWWQNTISLLTYVFPVYAVLPILAFSFGVKTFQIVWAIVIRVKSFIPFWGS